MKKLLKRESTYDFDTVEAFACICLGCLTCNCDCDGDATKHGSPSLQQSRITNNEMQKYSSK